MDSSGMGAMTILAVETSCDETAASVVRNGREVLSDVVATQVADHEPYGGVVPEIASRKHVELLSQVIREALREAHINAEGLEGLDAVAVTRGPGLAGALLVGVACAKGLAWAAGKRLIGVNHIEAHISANFIGSAFEPPFLCLVVSGGHTELLFVSDYCKYETLGSTLDDAAGEAFDKTARVLGLGYPGGRKIDELAARGNPNAYDFPRALFRDGLDFSFSGMKTAVAQHIQKHGLNDVADAAASIQRAIVDVLVEKTVRAAEEKGISKIALAGGVAANTGLRSAMGEACAKRGWILNIPSVRYCTDNAAMVGAAAYYRALKGEYSGLDLNAEPGLEIS
jgi:N6-L-threonylcarbamoyladenine synthase